jgi:hypothetical protein
MKTITTKDAVVAYNHINKLKLQPLDNEEILAFLNVKKTIRPIVKGYEEFVEDARKQIITEDITSIVQRAQAKEEVTDEDAKKVMDAELRLRSIFKTEESKEHELDLPTLTTATLVKLIKECGMEAQDEDMLYFLFE